MLERRIFLMLLMVLAGLVVACDRPAAPVHQCSNGNYRAATGGTGVCRCINHLWECDEGSSGGLPDDSGGSGEATRAPTESP